MMFCLSEDEPADKSNTRGYNEYVTKYSGEKTYTVRGGEELQGIGVHGIKFGRTFGPYNRIAFYKGEEEKPEQCLRVELNFYHRDTSIKTEYPQTGITIYGPTDHEREFGDVRLPMGWGNIMIHILDNVACDDIGGETNGLLVYTVGTHLPKGS
jgi:hypothetical protein